MFPLRAVIEVLTVALTYKVGIEGWIWNYTVKNSKRCEHAFMASALKVALIRISNLQLPSTVLIILWFSPKDPWAQDFKPLNSFQHPDKRRSWPGGDEAGVRLNDRIALVRQIFSRPPFQTEPLNKSEAVVSPIAFVNWAGVPQGESVDAQHLGEV